MATPTNACSELVRFWLKTRHGCLVREGAPVKVKNGHSDIDLVALHPELKHISLPDGSTVGPRLIVETKDERDADAKGNAFGKFLQEDVERLEGGAYFPKGMGGVWFSMLREEHFERATKLFGRNDFHRLFVVHAMPPIVLEKLGPSLADQRIHWLVLSDVVRDLVSWLRDAPNHASLRNTLMGDLLLLLVKFCHMDIPSPQGEPATPIKPQ